MENSIQDQVAPKAGQKENKMGMHKFIDAQEMAKKYPETFEAPSIEELNQIKQDDSVKLCLNDERFWVKVIEVREDEIIGEVDNQLFEEQPFNLHDIIAFKREHIYAM